MYNQCLFDFFVKLNQLLLFLEQKSQKTVESTSQQSSLTQNASFQQHQQQQQQQQQQPSNRNLISTTSSTFQASGARLFGSMSQQPAGNLNLHSLLHFLYIK